MKYIVELFDYLNESPCVLVCALFMVISQGIVLLYEIWKKEN